MKSAGFWWSLVVVFYGDVFEPEGMCVLTSTTVGPIVSFAVLDLGLSLLVLFLFAYPLRVHMNQIKNKIANSANDGVMSKVLRKNLILSLLIILVTVTNLSVMT